MLDYGEAHDFLKSLGFTFTYDNSGSFSFSNTHVFWQGREFGVMYIHTMMFKKDGFIHQFSYNGFQPAQEFKDFVSKLKTRKDLINYYNKVDNKIVWYEP